MEWERGKGGGNRPGERRAADGEKERLRQWGAAVGAAQRGRFALPRLELERVKGGANRPGERRAADVLVEDLEVPHGLQLNCMGP